MKPYIIGETACNHEGDIRYLYRMVDDIAEIGLNAVKFHLLLNLESYMQKKHPLINEAKKWTFNKKEWDEVIGYSNKKGLDVVALCDDVESLEHINRRGDISALEIHATGLNDHFLLNAASKSDRQIILGIGGSMLDEIAYAVDFLKGKKRNKIMLMYGFQSYPTNYADINLSKMIKIKEMFGLSVGYADHTAFDDSDNEVISAMAAMMGVNVLEKHYTPDYGKERIDYHAAVGREQMLRIKELMRVALTAYGTGSLKMSKAELKYGNIGPMKKAIVAKKDIKKGERLSLDNLWFKRTGEESSVKQNQFLNLIGLEAIKDIEEDEIIDFSKVDYKFEKSDLKDFTRIERTEVRER